MNQTLLEALRCPSCTSELHLSAGTFDAQQGELRCLSCSTNFPIVNGIPRFVPASNYADNFGFQWNTFSKTQLDSFTGLPISHDRFYAQSKWDSKDMRGKKILDVGCGAGRFTEIALQSGATVYAIDFSSAVDACASNLNQHDNLNIVQADIFQLPFEQNYFDYVYCFGVLQHTPSVEKALAALPPYLKPNGQLAVDVYQLKWHSYFHPKRILRPITTRMPKDKLFNLVQIWSPKFLSLNETLRKIPLVGKYLPRFVPVADYTGVFAFDAKQIQEWAVLDTFDWLGPSFDRPITATKLKRLLSDLRLSSIEVEKPAFVIGRAQKNV